MKKNGICIDISNVVPGKGGTGGGIATYAINLITHIDSILTPANPKVYCLKNVDFNGLADLKNIEVIDIKVNNSNFISRLTWLHLRLPAFCRSKSIAILHRIVPELPLIKVCKYIITLHDFMFDFYLERPDLKKYLSGTDFLKFKLFKTFSKRAIQSSDRIIVPAETILRELKERYPGYANKAVCIYEASAFSQNALIEKKIGAINIGVVAGFYPHKGHLQVLRLAKKILDAGFDNFKIFMRGSKVYQGYVNEVEREIKDLALEHYVVFQPFVKDIALQEIYSNFNFVLLLSQYEGFGLPVLEAQSHGVPVICSRLPIFEEILQQSAFYVDADVTTETVDELISRLTNSALQREKTESGFENVNRFAWGKMAYETLSLYDVC